MCLHRDCRSNDAKDILSAQVTPERFILRALVVGPGYHDYNESIVRGFHDLGMDADSFPFSETAIFRHYSPDLMHSVEKEKRDSIGVTPRALKGLLKRTVLEKGVIGPDIPNLRRFGKSILKRVESNRYDLLLIIKGNVILPETLLAIKKSNPNLRLALWQQDSMYRYPTVQRGAKHYDYICVTEPMDLHYLHEIGTPGSVLPSCYDPSIYRPLSQDGRRTYRRHLTFVGEGRTERFEFFISLATKLSEIQRRATISIFGARWKPFCEMISRYEKPGIRWDIVPEDICPAMANQVYNESMICLNIHHEQARTGMNLRTFEIPGSRSLEIVDRKETLRQYFDEGKDLIAFEPGDNLHEIIASLLDDPQRIESMSVSAHKRAIREHTYACRIAELTRRL